MLIVQLVTEVLMRIIALEEEFITNKVMQEIGGSSQFHYTLETSSEIIGQSLESAFVDLGANRIAAMDEAGIDLQVLSFAAPQVSDPVRSVEMMTEANNSAFEAVKSYPTRFSAFASLPLASPDAASDELERCLNSLGFAGAFIAGSINGEFLDHPKFRPVLECAQANECPIYLHPYFPLPGLMESYFKGREELGGPEWGFMIDASCHFLRLVTSGTFDRFPDLKIILGHLGESIPYNLDRIVNRLRAYAEGKRLKKPVGDYFRENLVVTTSGNFSVPSLMCAINTIGIDNVMFSVDWPNESNKAGVDFLNHIPISKTDLEKIAHRNAERILKI